MGRVLVAEDSPEICQLLAIALRREGIEVDCVSNGRDALNRISQNGYSVLILDLMMPVVSGFEVIDELARMKRERPPPATVVITAGRQRREELNSEVVVAVFTKPFDVFGLARIIAAMAEAARMSARNEGADPPG